MMPRPPKALPGIFLSILLCALAVSGQETPAQNASRDHAAERAEYHRSGRTAKGENAADLLHRGYQQKMLMRDAARAKRSLETARVHPEIGQAPDFSSLVWQSMGPSPLVFDPSGVSAYGNVTGRVSAIAVDQNDTTGNTVYIGGASGGVWKSTNAASSDPNAVTWTPLTDDQASLAVGAIAVQPGGNVLLVGTGETNSSSDSYYGQGILRSADGGLSWTLISSANGGTRSFRGLGFSRIAFSSANPNLVVAAAASTNAASPGGNGGELQGANGRGIYYSTDAGVTWTYAAINDPSGPTQPGSVGDIVFDPVHGLFYTVVRWHGYYSSTDGATWTRLANQPGGITSANCPASPTNNSCPEYRGSLTVNEQTGEVYTIFVDANEQTTADGGGIFLLTQPGGTWAQMGQAGIDACGDPGGNGCGAQQGTYNLYIKAVPNGANTDLFVGAENIFKCSRNASNPFCSNSGSWLNLTHVYGCSPFAAPSHVHPDQHAIDFSKTALPIHVYFGNDGGVWRALDETALASGSCAGSNPFNDLNRTLGSLSEFVSFSQNPTDPGTILGGLQDNGSPALVPGNSGANGLLWQGLNDSDGGYNAIDPTAPTVFYTSFPAVSDSIVQRCVTGTSCNRGSWATVVGSAQIQGDGAAFYPPWMLDPQNSTKLLIGTCRLWRGPAAGGSYAQLSNNFSSGDSTACAGATSSGDTKIRSIAMGGATTANGSQVIYAGMVGAAPLNGHVFVTTNADGGPSTWADRTGSINPSGYDISDIAISPYDPSGHTAYLTVMGFGTGHIFKTTDAGGTWTDKSGNLPDVPANSVLVDPVNTNTLYLGNDIGVFVSTDDGGSWAELGTGLPNAPAVKLKMFVTANDERLRVATYGRGLWQVDFNPAPPPPPPPPVGDIAFVGAPPSFAAVVGRTSAPHLVTISNSYATPVTITSITASGDFSVSNTCQAVLAASATCAVSVTFRPHAAGTALGTLTLASDAPGNPRTLTLSGQGVDFSLTLIGPRPTRPSRGANSKSGAVITLIPGETVTVNVALSVTDPSSLSTLPAAEKVVELQCDDVPVGIHCSVEPPSIDLAQSVGSVRVLLSAGGASRAVRLQPRKANTSSVNICARVGSVTKSLPVQLLVH